MKVTAHFSSEEFDCKNGTPYPAKHIAGRLTPLCLVLEAIRTAAGGKSVSIVSGYRPEDYNRSIGGARKSRHVQGDAADIKIAGMSVRATHDLALRLHQEGKIVIGGLGSYPSFTHIDIRPGPRLVRWMGSRSNS